MTTKQRFFSLALLLELIFLLLYVWVSDISFSRAARNLGVIFDSELALKELVNKLCQLAYQDIRRIGSIRQYLSVYATRTLVSSLFSLGLIIAMLSLLAVLRFSLIISRE